MSSLPPKDLKNPEAYFEGLGYDYEQIGLQFQLAQKAGSLTADELCGQGIVLFRMAQFGAAESTLRKAAELGSELAAIELCACWLAVYKFSEAIEGIETLQGNVSPEHEPLLRMRQGVILGYTGQLIAGLEHIHASYELYKAYHNRRGMEESSSYLGAFYTLKGDFEKARYYIDNSLRLGQTKNDVYLTLDTKTRLVILLSYINDFDEAVKAVDSASADFAHMPRTSGVFYYYQDGLRKTALGFMIDQKLQFLSNIFGFKEVVEDRSYDNLEAVFWLAPMLIDAFIKTGNNNFALLMMNTSLPDEDFRPAGCRAFEAIIYQKMGDYDKSISILRESLQKADTGGYFFDKLRCQMYLADTLYKAGYARESLTLLESALLTISKAPMNYLVKNDIENISGLLNFAKSQPHISSLVKKIEDRNGDQHRSSLRIKGIGEPLVVFGDIRVNWKLDAVATALILLYLKLHPHSTIKDIAKSVLTEKFQESEKKAEAYVRQVIFQIRSEFGEDAILTSRASNKTLPAKLRLGDSFKVFSDYEYIIQEIDHKNLEGVFSVYNAQFANDYVSVFTDTERERLQELIFELITIYASGLNVPDNELLEARKAQVRLELVTPQGELQNIMRWLHLFRNIHPDDTRAADLLKDLSVSASRLLGND